MIAVVDIRPLPHNNPIAIAILLHSLLSIQKTEMIAAAAVLVCIRFSEQMVTMQSTICDGWLAHNEHTKGLSYRLSKKNAATY